MGGGRPGSTRSTGGRPAASLRSFMGFDVARLAETSLIDPDGEPHRLGDLWQERPAVLLFLRHFG